MLEGSGEVPAARKQGTHLGRRRVVRLYSSLHVLGVEGDAVAEPAEDLGVVNPSLPLPSRTLDSPGEACGGA